MAQGLNIASTQISDAKNNIASIDTSSQQLKVQEPTVQDILQNQTNLLQNMSDYLEALFQPKTSSAASLSVAIPSDNTVNINNQDTVVTGKITRTNGNLAIPSIEGCLDISLNGHNTLLISHTGGSTYAYWYSIDDYNWFQPSVVYVTTSGFHQGSGGSTSTTPLLIPCSGYKKVRAYCAAISTIPSFLTFRASYAPPINIMSYMLTYSNNQGSFFPNSYVIPKVTSSSYLSTTINKLKSVVQVGAGGTGITNAIYGFRTNNPNEFPVYLLFWASATLKASFNPNAFQAIAFAQLIPPGVFQILPNFYCLYSGGANNYIYTAASLSPTSYIPVPQAITATIYSFV